MNITKEELRLIINTISDNAFNLGLTYGVMQATPEENVKILNKFQETSFTHILKAYEKKEENNYEK